MVEDAAEAAKLRLRSDLRDAMATRDALRIRVLRSLIAALDNAQAVPPGERHERYRSHAFGDGSAEIARLTLEPAEVRGIFVREAEERRRAAEAFRTFGRADKADVLECEAAVVEAATPAA